MRFFGFIILAHQCCGALTCTPIVELPLDEPHLGVPPRKSCVAVNERGDVAVAWEDYEVIFPSSSTDPEEEEYEIKRSLKVAFTENGEWTIPQIISGQAEEINDLQCKVDAIGNITVAWRGGDIATVRKNVEGGQLLIDSTVFPLEEKGRGFPFELDPTGTIVYPPTEAIDLGSWAWITKDLAIGIADTGKKVCFWEQGDTTFSLAWQENGGGWQREEVVLSSPYFEKVHDLRIGIDPKENIWVIGTAFSPEMRGEGRAICAWGRSADGIWSDPVFISGYFERIADLQMAVDKVGNLLVVWKTDNEELYAVSKPADRRWSFPKRIFSADKTCNCGRLFKVFEQNRNLMLQADPFGNFFLVWQNLISAQDLGMIEATVYGAVFSSDRQKWTSPQCLTEGRYGLLGSFVMSKRGEGILGYEVFNGDDITKVHLQIDQLSFDSNKLN